MTLTLEDVSGHPAVSAEHLVELTDLTAFLYAESGLGSGVDVTLTLVDEHEMERLHREWMNLPGSTDVMSFPMDELRPGPPESPVLEGILGDIVLCPAVATVQAKEAGHSLVDELCLLTTHGMLHLLGHDHEEDASRAAMFGLQKDLLEQFLGRAAPIPTTAE